MIRQKRRIRKVSKVEAALNFYIYQSYRVLVGTFAVLLFLYLYFLFSAIYNTAVAKSLQVDIAKAESEISTLEAEYVTKYSLITPENTKKENADFIILDSNSKKFVKVDRYLGMAN